MMFSGDLRTEIVEEVASHRKMSLPEKITTLKHLRDIYADFNDLALNGLIDRRLKELEQ